MHKFIYMLTLQPKGVPTKLLKFFCLKGFSICHRCRWHRWQTLSCEYLHEFSKKFETALMEAWGKLVQEKNQKQKISWHCPFNALWLQGTEGNKKGQKSLLGFTIFGMCVCLYYPVCAILRILWALYPYKRMVLTWGPVLTAGSHW